MVELKYRARVISSQDILYIRELIARYPSESRRTLSTMLCEAWQWKQANGALRDMVCRGMLLMLDRAGQIELPPVKFVPHNPLARRARPARVAIDTTSLEGGLDQIQPLELVQVRRSGEEPLFNSLMEEHHYLGYEQPVGEHLKYLVCAGPADRLSGVVERAATPWRARSLHRLERRGATPEHSLCRLQHPISDFAVGSDEASGFAHSGVHGCANLRGLAADVRSSDLLSGNVRRSGAIPRHLLPRSQLGVAGQHDRTRQTIQ